MGPIAIGFVVRAGVFKNHGVYELGWQFFYGHEVFNLVWNVVSVFLWP